MYKEETTYNMLKIFKGLAAVEALIQHKKEHDHGEEGHYHSGGHGHGEGHGGGGHGGGGHGGGHGNGHEKP